MRPLRSDPVPPLLAARDEALRYLVRRDLLGEPAAAVTGLWELPAAVRLAGRQQPDGRWRYPGGNPAIRCKDDYDQLETYRALGLLVSEFCCDRRHPAVARAAGFLASFQTPDGDYRGIYGRQYTPNYSAAITELLIRAGYEGTAQVENAMRWLAAMRQHDGGWAIPARTRGFSLKDTLTAGETVEPDRHRPSSHLVTGIVLRALAAHSRYRRLPLARAAGELLKSRFFRRDAYPDHAARSYWTTFSFPFWWTDLLSALDSLAALGFGADDPDVASGLDWFADNQEPGGLWNTGRNRPKGRYADLWVGYAVCRMLTSIAPGDRPAAWRPAMAARIEP